MVLLLHEVLHMFNPWFFTCSVGGKDDGIIGHSWKKFFQIFFDHNLANTCPFGMTKGYKMICSKIHQTHGISMVNLGCWSSARKTKATFGGVLNSNHFDCDCEFDCSIFYRPPKIVKIIICILCIHGNVTVILFRAILICGVDCIIILFQSCRNLLLYQESTLVLKLS